MAKNKTPEWGNMLGKFPAEGNEIKDTEVKGKGYLRKQLFGGKAESEGEPSAEPATE